MKSIVQRVRRIPKQFPIRQIVSKDHLYAFHIADLQTVCSFSSLSTDLTPLEDLPPDREQDIEVKFTPHQKTKKSALGLVNTEKEKQPLVKWSRVDREREQRFGSELVSGRGHHGDVPPSHLIGGFRSAPSGFRATGLAYHAWEQKLKQKPLPEMPRLTELRQRNASDIHLQNSSVLSVLSDVDTLSGAFLSMYCRHGSMEDARKELKSSGLPWLKLMAARLQDGSYIFPQLPHLEPKTMKVPKYDGSLEEVPIWWNKTIPEAMRLILEAVFEPQFLRNSHGYRPDKGCYSALKDIKYTFAGVDYFLVGDLSPCLETIDKSFLMKTINSRITDKAFLKLMEEILRAGYVQLSAVSYKGIGLPQTTLLSPILCNIYLHAMDSWFDDLSKCLTVGGGGITAQEGENLQGVLENRMKWGSKQILDFRCWKSASLKSVRYVRYGTDVLIGVNGLETDMDQFEIDLVRVLKSQLSVDYKKFLYNRAAASSPEKEYVVFLGAEIYVSPQISSPGLLPNSTEAGRLPNRPRLCVPARLLVKKLEEQGFVNRETKRPSYCSRLVMWECHEIVKYYDIVMKLFCMYYSFADNYHCLMLLYDVMKQSCSLTLARKLGLKRMWHVYKHFDKDMIIRDMEGIALASFERPIFKRPLDPFLGRDINPFVRIEKPSRPKFPPIKVGEAFLDPKFPRSKIEIGLKQAKINDTQSSTLS